MIARSPGYGVSRSKVAGTAFIFCSSLYSLIKRGDTLNQFCNELAQTSANVEKNLCLVVDELEQLVNLTEEKYAYIYQCLPTSERDVQLSIREVEILLNYLIYNSLSSDAVEQSVVVKTLNKVLAEFEEVTATFLNEDLVSVMMRTFLNTSGDERQSFSELITVAKEVEEALSVLRDLALNSIIFAIRVGEQGAGFQILSDRINQVSLELGAKFADMKTTINRLNDWNEGFQKTLVEFVNYEEELKNKYTNKFNEEFQHINVTLKTVCDILKDNLGNTKTAFNGVGQIMVMIQNQDIVRQNIENLVKCLKLVTDRNDSTDQFEGENYLDYVAFALRVLELAGELIGNIEDSLNESILALGSLLGEMDATASDLEEDAHYLAKFFAGDEAGQALDCVLKNVFNTVLGQVVDLMYIKKRIDSKSSMLSEGKRTFIELMEMLEKDLFAINKEAKGLKKMKVLIKIELARIDLESDFSLDSIISAVDQVIDTIYENQRLFMELRNYFFKNINDFNTAIDFTKSKLESSTDTLSGAKNKMEITGQLARGAVLASDREMKDIFLNIKQPCQHFADTEVIADLLASAKSRISDMRIFLLQKQEKLFEQHGVDKWEGRDEDIRLLTEQFTCLIERKAMNTVTTGAIKDIGSDGGDIVLF